MIELENHKACMDLIDFYRSYTERKDGDFRLWNENEEVSFDAPYDEDFRIELGDNWPTPLRDFNNPLKLLKSLRIVQVTTVVANGKVVRVKAKKRVNHELD
jgi:hypothetical protein